MSDLFLTIGETAVFFGTTPATVRGLVVAHGLDTFRVKSNGKAKGLRLPQLRVIARALGKPSPKFSEVRRFAAVVFA